MVTKRLGSFICILILSACSPKQDVQKQGESSETVEKSESVKPKVTDDKNYLVQLPKETNELIITPTPGYKINADFPHRAQLSVERSKRLQR